MITRVLHARLPLMIYTPVKVFDIPYFHAIFSAGALPVFDTECLSQEEILQKTAQLSKENISFGIRLASLDPLLLEALEKQPVSNLDAVVVPVSKTDGLSRKPDLGDTRLVLEIKDIGLLDPIAKADPHALILKGNEAAGQVSRYSSFILMQWYLKNQDRPVFIHGGVGQYTGAGMLAAGVSGFVMDTQVLLADEAPVSPAFKNLLASVEEGDSTEISIQDKQVFRVFAKLGTKIVKELKQQAVVLGEQPDGEQQLYKKISSQIIALNDSDAPFVQSLFFMGQDGLFARHLAKKSNNLSDMIHHFFTTIGANLDCVDRFDPVIEHSPFARNQNTRLPLIQGPMANISDNPEFAAQVLAAGALPFFAVGSLPASLADKMLSKGKEKVPNCGAGLVGIEAFNPMVHKHLDMVKKYQIPFALFAGGIPSQVRDLEAAGTKTYLHTPSVPMMENALKSGCVRFIFEGGEAGGHVGFLSSLVLWEAAIEKLVSRNQDMSKLSLVFAGGISTCFASFFISGMTSFLAQKGACIGLQVGTAYLFSREIVETRSMTRQYQDIIIEKDETVVIGKSLGLASRTAPTPFAKMMKELEDTMIRDKVGLDERKRAFEKKNIGSLLIGAKGFLPDFKRPGEQYYTWYKDEAHREKGNFLVGDSLAFFKKSITIQDIHDTYFTSRSRLFQHLNQLEIFSSPNNKIHDEIAVVGMGCTLPDADTPDQLWENILGKKYTIKPMPEDRFDKDLYYSPDRKAEDRTYTILAGFVDHFEFDYERFGYAPEKAKRLSRSQQMVLATAYKAVEDAGLLDEKDKMTCEDPQKTAVVIATCLSNELGNTLQLKYWFPQLVSMMEKSPAYAALSDDEKQRICQSLQDHLEGENKGYDPVHGILLNIEASRIARHLGVRGANYIVDAACASSVTAVEAAVGELLSGEHDQVIVGGVNTHLAPESFIGFAKMGTLSEKGSYPFDQRADGFVLGEGSVIFVLKRMKDAIRDNNRILGIINGIGASSDGRGKAIAAPNPKGQILSVQRCFEHTRPEITPENIGFIEAHGTSTIIGDAAELETLNTWYKHSHAGISSIKSQIGHLLGAAGAAGLIKALLAVNKGMLPPNGQFKALSKNHDMTDSSLFIIQEPKTWQRPENAPRRAAVSSYGFGGINYHMVVEEMTRFYRPLTRDIFTDTAYDFNDDRIVVAGLGVFLPGAKNSEQFWEKLCSGEKQLSHLGDDHFDNAAYAGFPKNSIFHLPKVKAGIVKDYKFNNLKYRMPPTMVKSIERAQIFGLEAADEALSSSGLLSVDGGPARTGVILGTIAGERQSKNIIRVRKQFIANAITACDGVAKTVTRAVADDLLAAIRQAIPENNEDTTPGLLSNIISGRIANHFGLNGANYVIDASCASATIAIRNAARVLKQKDLDFVLAGGVDCNLYPAVLMAFKRLGLLSSTDGYFFDNRAEGYVMGEGAAIHVLTTLKKAREAGMDILGEIHECTVRSSVPDHLLAPSEHTFKSVIDEAYKRSGILKSEIRHLDLFAFSNVFGDMIEQQVIQAGFSHSMHCGNIKPQFGYFKAANPAVALAKLMLMNARGKILPDFNYDPNHSTLKDSKVLQPVQKPVDRKPGHPLRFAANVNGIGGNHAHLIMGTLPRVLEPVVQTAEEPVIEAQYKQVSGDDLVMTDTAYSADPGGKKLRMVALLSGQGAQRPGMMKALYDADSHIRKVLDKGDDIFFKIRGYSLLDLMFGDDNALNSTQNTQPAVFLSSAAICSRLGLEGFSPDYFIGHSVGEYTALFCSGMLGFEDAMRLIIKRSDLMYESTVKQPGKIMVVFKNEKETESLLRKSFISNIYITNKNSEKQTAVSGKAADIDKFCTYLSQQDVSFKKLNLTGAFHTPLLQQAADELRTFLDTVSFNTTRFGKIISNTLARPYPEKENEVKDLLARQIVSPVEFIRSVEHVYVSGRTHFIEIGPSRLLVNLLKHINIGEYGTAVTVDSREGETESFEACRQYLIACNSLFEHTPGRVTGAVAALDEQPRPGQQDQAEQQNQTPIEEALPQINMTRDFEAFKDENKELLDRILYKEFERRKREAAIDAIDRFDFNTGRVLISGVSVGLPGKGRRVFAKDNFDAILNGENFIEPLTREDQELITDKNITKLYKQPDGNARFVQITRTEDVIHLAGQLGYFDLTDEYGIKEEYDVAMSLGIAAGIEALKDANIPLVMQYKKMKGGRNMVPDGFALPAEMQEDTGVIITSLWPNGETLMAELEKYYYEKFFLRPHEEVEKIYYYLMERVKDMEIKEELTDWFFKSKARKRKDFSTYTFDRNFLANACPLGSAHLAMIIKAKGPNTLVSSACASTTLAIGIAEDWIRTGRCKRVLVVGGENATSPRQNQWVGSGFLALGAATIKKRVSEAAKPFDEDRNGTILGSGAVGLVIEAESEVQRRGMNGQCEILGTHIANSAYHTYNIDVPHMAKEMTRFISKVEKRTGLKKQDYADKLLFMSHETYTPARGGSADAEVTALETAFAGHLNSICISNTKGFTGHTLGAAIEDVVLVKALQKRKAPPIANLTKIPDHFKKLNFSGQDNIDSEYGLHLSAGFGSHFAFMFVKRIQENPVEGNLAYHKWLRSISGAQRPELKMIDNTLCVVAGDPAAPAAVPDMRPQAQPRPAVLPVSTLSPVPGKPVVETAAERKAAPSATKMAERPVATSSGNLAGAADTGPDRALAAAKITQVIADQTGYTPDMLEHDLDLEADLGIDTVKQVEIFGKIATQFGFPVPDDLRLRDLNTIDKLAGYVAARSASGSGAAMPGDGIAAAPASSTEQVPDTPGRESVRPGAAHTMDSGERIVTPAVPADQVLTAVKDIISAQTGYTPDMLDDDLDLEADLGIDTVKQVEIFGKVATQFGFAVPDDLRLRDLNTIARLAAYVAARTAGTGGEAAATETRPGAENRARSLTGEGDDDGDAIDTPVPAAAHTMDSGERVVTKSRTGGEDTAAVVKDVIARQTGYTPDMLADDLDLEADLGIDTVKQVEIFGKVAGHFGFAVPDDLRLRDLNTIEKLTAYIRARVPASPVPREEDTIPVTGSSDAEPTQPAAPETLGANDIFPDPASPIKRLVVRVNEADMPAPGRPDFSGHRILISMDSHGFAKAVTLRIQSLGGEVITLGPGDADVTADLSDLDGFQAVIEAFARTGPGITGLIHLASLDAYFDRNNREFASDADVNTTVKSLFLLLKTLFDKLDAPDTLIGTLAFDSVVFPYMDDCGEIHPLFGALSGLLKTANKELENTRVKVVDFSYKYPKKSLARIADLFLGELLCADPRCEVGYKNKKRYVLSMHPETARKDPPIVSDGDTLLVTGGAGGITYEILKQVVAAYKVNLVILDINDIYATDPELLKPDASEADLMALLRNQMPGEKPVAVKQALDRLLRVRQSIANIEHLKAQGIFVDYHCTDVTDYQAVKKAVDACERIDGIFHAAGMEMSQFIPKKERTAFERVVDVKVKGLRHLLAAAKEREYRYFFTFSSVTARFGNQGQADYTAANDFLGKALFREKQQHPEKTYKVYAWTAWGGVGMATNPTVKKVLEDRGIQFLPLDQGVKFFMADLLDQTESEMVFSGLDYDFDIDGLLGTPQDQTFPFLGGLTHKETDTAVWTRVLDLDHDLFLHDHTMGDVPLFLGATGIETMAEAAAALAGEGAVVTGLSGFSIPYGIKLLKGRPKEIIVSSTRQAAGQYGCDITSVFKTPDGRVMGDPKLHYQGNFSLATERPSPETMALPEFYPVSWEGDLADLVYHPRRLFMFGLFETITDINSFDGTTLVTTVADRSAAPFFKGVTDPMFQAAPVLVDAMFQTGGLLEFLTTSRTVLPFRIASMTFFAAVARHVDYLCITEKKASGEETNTYDLTLTDSFGKVFIKITGFEMVKLNRLAPEDQIAGKVTFTETVA
jgi:acyl transferase domain-containing protein/NAD(P)H-dependent flavin oxidoreductase YrpB (nitropropane dioxygenase family)/acyl carrier protein/NAD(P)-dependent dehydrogenase (short-subunit alcohol dehydrogenase family)